MQIQLHETQDTVAADRHRFRVICSGRRWGKTTLAIDTMIGCALYKPDARIAYIAPTFQQARDIAWSQLKKDVAQAGATVNESRLEITLQNEAGGKGFIILRGWESIETLRGQLFDLVVLDEVASMRNFNSSWNEVVRPTLTDRKGEAMFISTPKGFNHFYDLYNQQEKDSDYKSYHFTSYDNPHIPSEELDKARQEIGEIRFGQEYLADFKKMEGLVYKEFNRALHVITPEFEKQFVRPENMVEKLGSVDFGFTHPCAVLTTYRDSADNFYVVEEWYETGKTEDQIADYVAACNFNKVYPDPESPSAIATLKKRGVNVREVIKGKDSVKNGINKVRELLRANKLYISASCVNLLFEFETYAYPDDVKGISENPIKENDDALDSLRYVIMMVTKGGSQYAHQFRPSTISGRPSPMNSRTDTQVIPNKTAPQYRPAYKGVTLPTNYGDSVG